MEADLRMVLGRNSDVDILLEIDCQGMRQIKQKFPDACTIIVLPENFEVLEARIRARDRGESEEEITVRLADAQAEIACAHEFKHQIVNTTADLKSALGELIRIMKETRRETMSSC